MAGSIRTNELAPRPLVPHTETTAPRKLAGDREQVVVEISLPQRIDVIREPDIEPERQRPTRRLNDRGDALAHEPKGSSRPTITGHAVHTPAG
jgi:hypothetical protein